ncbi:MAG: Ppx/GppA phosphatase family protein [Thermoleophilia bacterium]
MTRLAVIDTGTNSTRLLVADTSPGMVSEVFRQTTITRLGEGVQQSGMLSTRARRKVSECLVSYAATIGELGAMRTLVIATSSVRDARDGVEFLTMLAHRFAFKQRLLTGREEASLSYAGATMGLTPGIKAMLFDVGGGSTEVVVGRGELVEFAVSMKLGCVRLSEMYFRGDPVSARELDAATGYIDDRLRDQVPLATVSDIQQALAVAGTVTAMAVIDLGLDEYDRDLVHGHVLTSQTIDGILERLSALSLARRLELPGMESGRADVIVAGALIVARLIRHVGLTEITVSEYDIMDGVALAMAAGRL